MGEKISDIYRTTDYSKFKRLDGNRAIRAKSVKAIKESIVRVGYIMSPICVNEKFEIIDGQYRSCALQELGMPVDYYIVEGAGIKECRSMNLNQGNWKLRDFIDSYAELGEQSYIYLAKLLEEFKQLGVAPVIYAATGMQRADKVVRGGELVITQLDYENAVKNLTALMDYYPIVNGLDGRHECFYTALIYCFSHPEIDQEELFLRIRERQRELIPPTNVAQALRSIEYVYNFRKQKKVYLESDYIKHQDRAKTKAARDRKRRQRAKTEEEADE